MIALYLKFFIALFAVINPIGVMPVISNLTEGFDKKEQKMVVKTTTVAIFIILIVSLFLGQIILNIFSISLNSFRIAGGILITLIAFTMINGKLTEEKQNKEEKQDINNIKNFAVVPLAIPILAGPGAISTTIMWGAKYNNWIDLLGLSVAIIAKLKEGDTPQKIMIQGYNYDLINNKEIKVADVLAKNKVDVATANSKIEKVIKKADNTLYKRELTNTIYSIDKVTNFILVRNGELYIIYAYGNQANVYTSEMDIVQI